MKYEFLHHYHQANGLPLRNRLFGHIAQLSRLGLAAGARVELDRRARWPNRWLMERVVGHRPAPPAAAPSRARPSPTGSTAAGGRVDAPRGDVVLFHDTFITYNTPEIGRAAVELLEAAGYRVELVDQQVLRAAAHLQGHAGRGAGARALERGAPGPCAWRGAPPSSGSSPPACSRCATSTSELVPTTEAARGGAARASSSRSSCCASARGGSRCRSTAGRRAAPCSTATATRRRMVGTAPDRGRAARGRASR